MQQNQVARPTTAARQAAGIAGQPAEEGDTRGALLQALAQLDAKLSRPAGSRPECIAAGVQQQQLAGQRPLHPAATSSTPCVGGTGPVSPLNMPATAEAQAASATTGAAGSGQPSPPVDPLADLLAALVAAEAGGDPFSIINLFVEEQLQTGAAAAGAAAGASKRRGGWGSAEAAARQAGRQPVSGRSVCPGTPADAAAWQPLGHGTEQDEAAAAAAAAGGRPVSAASDRENMPANVALARHRWAGSMLLQNFDASAGQQIGNCRRPATPAPNAAASGPSCRRR